MVSKKRKTSRGKTTRAPEPRGFPVKKLLVWYKKNGRDLPWRATKDPYQVWISEVILQQTQVSRGLSYYQRFLEKFPDVGSLACASWSSVLSVWRGLGYYERARRLRLAAKIVARQKSFPKTVLELEKLPGIGPYTARAIAANCYSSPVLAVDTNVTRVLSRYFDLKKQDLLKHTEAIEKIAGRRSAQVSQAMMDLASAICLTKIPKCHECPLCSTCASSQKDFSLVNVRSQGKPNRRKTSNQSSLNTEIQDVGCACIHKNGKYLLAQRPKEKGAEWEFPGGKREDGEDVRACIKREVKEEIGVEVSVRPAFHVETTTLRSRKLRLHFCRTQILSGKPICTEHQKLAWVAPSDFGNYKMLKSNTEVLEILKKRFRR